MNVDFLGFIYWNLLLDENRKERNEKNDYQIVLEYTEEERRKEKVPDRKWR